MNEKPEYLPGDLVKLKSGGPLMTVCEWNANEESGTILYTTVWHTEDGVMRLACMNGDVLTRPQ